jgi:hypothetical protein
VVVGFFHAEKDDNECDAVEDGTPVLSSVSDPSIEQTVEHTKTHCHPCPSLMNPEMTGARKLDPARNKA